MEWALLAALGGAAGPLPRADRLGGGRPSADRHSRANQSPTTSTGKSGARLKCCPRHSQTLRVDSAVTAAPVRQTSSGLSGARCRNNAMPRTGRRTRSLVAVPAEPKPIENLSPSRSRTGEGGEAYACAEPCHPRRDQAQRPGETAAAGTGVRAPSEHEFKEGCPSPKDLKHIADLTTNITPPEGELPHDCPLGNAVFQPRCFAPPLHLDGFGAVPQAALL